MLAALPWKVPIVACLLGCGLGAGVGEPWRKAPEAVGAENHYAPHENLERIDVALIDETRRTLDLAAYVLTERTVIAAIERAARWGVVVRIWRDPEMAEKVRASVARTVRNVNQLHDAIGCVTLRR